jgi:hypothetical protein
MKKLLPFLSIALMAAACNSGPRNTELKSDQQMVDTSGLSAFTAWKAEQAINLDEAQTVQYVAPAKQAVKKTVAKKPASRPASSGNNSSVGNASNEPVVLNNESAEPAKAPEKKGWSKAAKGAVIGGVAGAAGGAVINKKNRVVGAVIGAVVGAGGGYAIGRGMDKKDGRYLIPQ